MTDEAVRAALADIPGWALGPDGTSISRRFRFGDFDAAFSAVSAVASLAAEQDHHPDVSFGWGYAAFTLTTHAIGGLHGNDFTVARAIDGMLLGADEHRG